MPTFNFGRISSGVVAILQSGSLYASATFSAHYLKTYGSSPLVIPPFLIESNSERRRAFKKYSKINKKKALIFRLGPFKFGAGNETRTRKTPTLARVTDIKCIKLHNWYFNKLYI